MVFGGVRVPDWARADCLYRLLFSCWLSSWLSSRMTSSLNLQRVCCGSNHKAMAETEVPRSQVSAWHMKKATSTQEHSWSQGERAAFLNLSVKYICICKQQQKHNNNKKFRTQDHSVRLPFESLDYKRMIKNYLFIFSVICKEGGSHKFILQIFY